ncbi:MAG: hypothetical protein ACRENP_03655 [Longimicrobiales bacterium]
MRGLRKALEIGLPIAGTVLVFAAVVLVYNLTAQIILVLIGLLMIDAGIWKLTAPLFPNERRYKALRDEVDRFIHLVRRLNTAALSMREHDSAAARTAFQDAVNALHHSVGKIEQLAGKTEDELRAPPAVAGH